MPRPMGVQGLLYNYVWDANLVRDDLRDYAVEHLGDANGVLAGSFNCWKVVR